MFLKKLLVKEEYGCAKSGRQKLFTLVVTQSKKSNCAGGDKGILVMST